MNPRRLTRTLVVLSLMWAGILFAHQQHIRRIPFRLDLPIAERLLPEDELVIIEESPVPPGRVASGIAPLEVEFDRLALSEAAVVVERRDAAPAGRFRHST